MYFLIYLASLDDKSFNNSSDYIQMSCWAERPPFSLEILT